MEEDLVRRALLFVVAFAGCCETSVAQTVQPEEFTFTDRMKWVAKTAVGPKRLAGNIVSSGIATGTNTPREYGPHWEGFGKRIGLRMTTGATGLMMEGSIGALWGEDPRYYSATGKPVKARLWNVVRMSFMARNSEGRTVPAYARYISVPATSYATNLWRPDSHATASRAAVRIPLSFLDRIISNAFSEFWPDMMKPLQRHRNEVK